MEYENYLKLENDITIENLEYIDSVLGVDWEELSEKTKLTEDIIRKFSEKLEWNNIEFYQVLSEALMRDFSHKLDFKIISSGLIVTKSQYLFTNPSRICGIFL